MNFFNTKKGFSLIEVLLAVFIIGVGVVPVLSLFLSSSRTVGHGGVVLEASIIAQNILDKARSDSFIWANVPLTLDIPDAARPEFDLPESFKERYQASATLIIESAPDHTVIGTGANETNLLQLTAIVNWVEHGMSRNFRLITYRANTNPINLKSSARF